MARSPSVSACHTNRERWARRWAATRSPSSCRAIACWGPTARWAASRPMGASPPSGASSRSKAQQPWAQGHCSRAYAGAMPEFGFDPAAATRHLRKADPGLARLIDAAGPFAMELKPARSVFGALAEAIVYQQLSNKAAATIFGRVCGHFPRGRAGLTPERLLALSDARIRAAGISRPKLKSLRDLARRSVAGEVPTLAEARRMVDAEIVGRLI